MTWHTKERWELEEDGWKQWEKEALEIKQQCVKEVQEQEQLNAERGKIELRELEGKEQLDAQETWGERGKS